MLKKIDVHHLRLGMFIHELCGSWMDHPFWRTRFELTDAEDIRRLQESAVSEVWIDTSRGHDVGKQETLAEAKDEAEVVAETERTLIEAAESAVAPAKVSMIQEVDGLNYAQIKDHIRRQAEIFSATKSYLIDRWNNFLPWDSDLF